MKILDRPDLNLIELLDPDMVANTIIEDLLHNVDIHQFVKKTDGWDIYRDFDKFKHI